MSGSNRRGGASRPLVDVVILTCDDGELLTDALRSALDSVGVEVVVWVVDNGSQPPASVPDLPNVHLVRNHANVGVGAGRNQGVALGSAPVVCLLDSDARLGADALFRLATALEADGVGVTVPVFVGQTPVASAGRAPSVRTKIARGLSLRDTYLATPGQGAGNAWDVEFGIGACQVFRREVFDLIGGIDDSDRFGPEDVDFCQRARAAGYRVLQLAGAPVHHPPRRAHRRLLTRRGVLHARALARYYRRRGSRG